MHVYFEHGYFLEVVRSVDPKATKKRRQVVAVLKLLSYVIYNLMTFCPAMQWNEGTTI